MKLHRSGGPPLRWSRRAENPLGLQSAARPGEHGEVRDLVDPVDALLIPEDVLDPAERVRGEKAGEKGAYRDLRRMVLGEPLEFASGSFSAAVCVGVFTTNHAPPEALDELVRIVEPGGWVIFSVRDDVYRDGGFEEKQASLENEGRWHRVTMSEAFQPFPAGNTSHLNHLFVYNTAA